MKADTTIYFDVSDLVAYATNYHRVSGIQRVIINLLRHTPEFANQTSLRVLFQDVHTQRIAVYGIQQFLGDDAEFDAVALSARLRQHVLNRWVPSKRSISRRLSAQGYRGLPRIAAKLKLYAAVLFRRQYLRDIGLLADKPVATDGQVPTMIDKLPKQATLVLLSPTMHCPQVTALALQHRAQGGEVMQLIHDLIPHLCPTYCDLLSVNAFTAWLSQAVLYTTRYLCVSQHSARDLRHYLGGLQARITTPIDVLPLAHEFTGAARHAPVNNEQAVPFLVNAQFVLFVGTIEPRKNCQQLIRTWAVLQKSLGARTPWLVIAGKNGWHHAEFYRCLDKHPSVRDRLLVLPAASDATIAWLYAHCWLHVFPSWYEGWGLPVGEAAWFGKYTLAAQRASIPEVLGDLAGYFDPSNESQLAAMLMRLLEHPEQLRAAERRLAAQPLRRWRDVAHDLTLHVTKHQLLTQAASSATVENSTEVTQGIPNFSV